MKERYRLGKCLIDAAGNTISRDGQTIEVRARSMAVLDVLAEAGGETLSRDVIFERVWGKVIVTDDALTQCIVELRRALGDDSRNPDLIRTVRGRGFQLLVAPTPAVGIRPRRVPLPAVVALGVMLILAALVLLEVIPVDEATSPAGETPRIAVLPFEDFSDPPREAFADGLTEEVINRVTALDGIAVIARTSAFKYKGQADDIRTIAAALDVTHVIEGSVRWAGEALRVTAQLIDASTGDHLWSENFDVPAGSALDVQDRVAIALGRRLGATLPARSPATLPLDLEVQLYEARRLLRERDFEASQRALAIHDELALAVPDSADAWLGRAAAALNLLWAGSNSGTRNYDRIFDESLTRALALAPDDPTGQSLMAQKLTLDGRLEDAIDVYRRAMVLHPRHAGLTSGLAQALRRNGELDEAAELTERLLALDPLNDRAHLNLGMIHWSRRAIDRAEAMFLKAAELALNPSDAWWSLGLLYADFGRLADAAGAYARAIETGDRAHLRIQRAALYLQLGMIDAARADHEVAATRFEQAGNRFIFGTWERVATGDTEALRRWLRQEAGAVSEKAYNGIVAALARSALGEAGEAETLLRNALLTRADESSLLYNPWDIDSGTVAALQYAAMLRAGGDESRHAELLAGALALLERESARALRPGYAYTRAQRLALAGEVAAATDALDLAVERGWRRLYWTRVDPALAGLRNTPGYAASLEALAAAVREERARLDDG